MKYLNRKKIALIYAGGTNFGPDFNIQMLKKWINNFFELQMMANVEPFFVYHGAGADIKWDLASEIAKVIEQNYKEYDGFVITHSLDNVVYTSSLLSFMIQKPTKPIIFTCPALPEDNTDPIPIKTAQPSFGEFETLDLRSSLINAVQISTLDVAEVGIVIGNHLARAVQTHFAWTSSQNYLESFQKKYLAKIQFGIHFSPHINKRSNKLLEYKLAYNSNIKILDSHPDINLPLDTKNSDGVFIKGTQEQIMPGSLLVKNIPVCIYTHNKNKTPKNVITCDGMSVETAIAKFIWVLGQTNNIKEIKKMMSNNLAGEY